MVANLTAFNLFNLVVVKQRSAERQGRRRLLPPAAVQEEEAQSPPCTTTVLLPRPREVLLLTTPAFLPPPRLLRILGNTAPTSRPSAGGVPRRTTSWARWLLQLQHRMLQTHSEFRRRRLLQYSLWARNRWFVTVQSVQTSPTSTNTNFRPISSRSTSSPAKQRIHLPS